MKVAFFYSELSKTHQQLSGRYILRQIDDLEYTELVTFEDDEEIKPFSSWPDNVLVTVIENVDTTSYGGIDYGSKALKGRVKINEKIQ